MRCIICSAAAAYALAFGAQEAAYAQPAKLISAHDLATLRDLDGLSVSPDGAWVAFQVRQADPQANLYRLEWFVVPTAGGAPRRFADGGDPILADTMGITHGAILAPPPVWSSDSRWIFYLRREGERTQIWRSRREGGETRQITQNEGDVRRMIFARDGARLLFETQPSRAQREEALVAEGRRGFLFDDRFAPDKSRAPVLPAGAVRVLEGGSAAAAESRSLTSAYKIWVYEFASGRERLANAAEQAEFAQLAVGRRPSGRSGFRGMSAESEGSALVWTEARDSEQQGAMAPMTVVAQPSGAGDAMVCGAPECAGQAIDGLWWRGEREIIFQRGEGAGFADTTLYAWRPREDNVRRILQTRNSLALELGEAGCSIARDRLICFYEQPDYPRRLAAIDLDTGAVDVLFDPNPDFAQFDLGASPQRLAVRTPSNVQTYGYLVLPPRFDSRRRLPLVIVTYSCSGFLRGGTGDEYPIYPFAAQGFAVLCLNLSRRFNAEPQVRMSSLEYTRWAWGAGVPIKRRAQEAIDAAVSQLDAAGVVNPDKIGLTGLSFGAQTVLYALSHMPRLSAAIASGSDHEPADYYLWGARAKVVMTQRGWGPLETTADRWREFSVSLNADRVRAPLLINAADDGMLTALMPVRALEDAGRAVEMYIFPDEFHYKWQPAHRLALYERNIDWMNFWLRGVEDPEPAKAAQYQRWRAMRERTPQQ